MTAFDTSQLLQDLFYGGTLVAAIFVGIFQFRKTNKTISKEDDTNYQQAIKSYEFVVNGYKEQVARLTEEIATLRARHTAEIANLQSGHAESLKLIGQLQGELKSYKELPLKSIADGLQAIQSSTDRVFERLESSAVIAADQQNNGGLMIKTKTDPATTENTHAVEANTLATDKNTESK